MRFVNLYVRTAVIGSLMLLASACQTAQKPVSLLPPGSAPALKPTAPSAAAPGPQADVAQPQEAPAQKPDSTEVAAPAQASVPDPVGDLIARAEKEYQAGLANHQAGKIEDAKQNFDNALNALLSSNLDVRSDERLEKEFDRIVAGVNELYPGGTSADAGSSQEQKSEPAPIDTTNELTPAADAGVKAKAQAEIKNTHSDLPLMMTDQVAGYITYFSGHGRGVFERAFARSGRYHDMIVSTFKQEGIPQDLIYLAQAESGFHPLAVSRVGARGIWQFMASRGRGYGLYHNMWVDDRQDPEKSTHAAARHLKDLYNQFGDWYLAMAAYNSGPGTVQAAVKRTGYADFWELYNRNVLPKETKNYVPIILAVTIMAKNPSQYGLDEVVMDQPAEYDTVTITYPVDLRLVAECVNSTPTELQDLNPSLLRLTTPRDGKFELHIPAGTKDQYETAINTIPRDMRLWWRYHTVHSGRHAGLAGTQLSHHGQVDLRSQPSRGHRTRSGRQARDSGRARQASDERHGDLRPPHHALQGSLWRYGRKRRRELRRLGANAAPLERHSRRQPPRTQSARPAPADFTERARQRSSLDAYQVETSGQHGKAHRNSRDEASRHQVGAD